LSLLEAEPILVDEGPAMKVLQVNDQGLNDLIRRNVLTNCTVVGARRLFRRAQIKALIEAETSTGTPKSAA
jgi:hypothetical protein